MRLQLWKKHISSIEELMGIIYENQTIFEALKRTDEAYKKEIVSTYLEEKNCRDNGNVKSQLLDYIHINSYSLSKFSLSISLKRYVLKETIKVPLLQKENGLNFSIKALHFTKKKLLILLEHNETDTVEDVLAYANAYVETYLERKLSIWEKIIAFVKKVFKKKTNR